MNQMSFWHISSQFIDQLIFEQLSIFRNWCTRKICSEPKVGVNLVRKNFFWFKKFKQIDINLQIDPSHLELKGEEIIREKKLPKKTGNHIIISLYVSFCWKLWHITRIASDIS